MPVLRASGAGLSRQVRGLSGFARRRTAEREERQRAAGRASDLIQYRLALKRRVDQRNGHDGR